MSDLNSANFAARTVGYQYNAVGNRQWVSDNGTTAHYKANSDNGYTSVDGISTEIDLNGNMVASPLKTENGTLKTGIYAYDAQNRLTSATVNGVTTEFTYDSRNRVVQRTSSNGTLNLTYSGWNLIEERNGGGELEQVYVHGAGIDEILVKITPDGPAYYHHDGLGSTIALTGENGELLESYRYDAFGAATILSPSTLDPRPSTAFGNRFLFTGREWLSQVGLYDYRNRVYSAQIGRFLQTDPIRFAAGDVNIYRYVSNNPVNLYDPYGLFSFDDVSNFSAGWGDTLTTIPFTNFSLTRETRNSLPGIYGDNGGVDRCSSAYGAGEWGGIANSLALGGKGLGNLASRIGNQSTRSRLYEIGQRTLTSGEYGKYSGIADPVRRGIAMVRDGASGAPSLSGMLTQSWKTIGTGLTPQAAASLGDIGAGFGGAAVGGTGLGIKAN